MLFGSVIIATNRSRPPQPEQANTSSTADDVWVVAGITPDNRGSVLFHSGDGALVDLDEEDSRTRDDRTRAATAQCKALFVNGGEPTAEALHRVKAAGSAAPYPVVIARVDGKRVIGSQVRATLDVADELATTWRKLGLPAAVRCGAPPLEELVLDPDARDE